MDDLVLKVRLLNAVNTHYDKESIYRALGETKWDQFPMVLDTLNRFLNQDVDIEVANAYLDLCRQEVEMEIERIEGKTDTKLTAPTITGNKFSVVRHSQKTDNLGFDLPAKVEFVRVENRNLVGIYINFKLPKLPDGIRWVNDIGFRLTKELVFEYGGFAMQKYDPTVFKIMYFTRNPGMINTDNPSIGYFPNQDYAPNNLENISIPLYIDNYIPVPHRPAIYHLHWAHLHTNPLKKLVNEVWIMSEVDPPVLEVEFVSEFTSSPVKKGIEETNMFSSFPLKHYPMIQFVLKNFPFTEGTKVLNTRTSANLSKDLFIYALDLTGKTIPLKRIKIDIADVEGYINYTDINTPRYDTWLQDMGAFPNEHIYYLPWSRMSHKPLPESYHKYRGLYPDIPEEYMRLTAYEMIIEVELFGSITSDGCELFVCSRQGNLFMETWEKDESAMVGMKIVI